MSLWKNGFQKPLGIRLTKSCVSATGLASHLEAWRVSIHDEHHVPTMLEQGEEVEQRVVEDLVRLEVSAPVEQQQGNVPGVQLIDPRELEETGVPILRNV
eukprot:TRINITY_DN17241_c0_g1_i1.p2 TRINITY_DN17241_c0_g1~~TRINITY_DN17241_c0_g1_i1.p2  ORF type:complete len:100 (-),score=10.41 TRINITY_DN17241_c0_g1_i1:48-347(-)